MTDKELDEIIIPNFLKYGWKPEQIDQLKKNKKMERAGKLQDGALMVETIEIKPKFEVIGV